MDRDRILAMADRITADVLNTSAETFFMNKFSKVVNKLNDVIKDVEDPDVKDELRRIVHQMNNKENTLRNITVLFEVYSKMLIDCVDAGYISPNHEIDLLDSIMNVGENTWHMSANDVLMSLYSRDYDELRNIETKLSNFHYDMKSLKNDMEEAKKQGVKYNYVTVYEHNQAYGGPEEGGWYYGVDNVIKSLPFSNENIENFIKEYNIEVSDPMGDWVSAKENNAKIDYYWLAKERKQGENASKGGKPHYE